MVSDPAVVGVTLIEADHLAEAVRLVVRPTLGQVDNVIDSDHTPFDDLTLIVCGSVHVVPGIAPLYVIRAI